VKKMKAEIISVGTELLLGQIVNSDAQIISELVSPLGIDMYYHTTVGDNSERLRGIFRQALERSDLIFTTGGLGPTMDDLTKETIAAELGLEMILDEKELAYLENMFTRRGGLMPQNNIKQAVFPKNSIVIANPNGTAPGVIVEKDQKIIVILPGPPRELRPMLVDTVLPYLQKKNGDQQAVIQSRVLKLCGLGESAAEEAIEDLIRQQSNPTIAPLAGNEVTFRITAKAPNGHEANRLIAELEAEVRQRIGRYVYGCDDDTLESVTGRMLVDLGLTLSLAESCTGGLISARITNIAGSSRYFDRGYVCYSNQAKVDLLGVPERVIAEHGAVSEETAGFMAKGAQEKSSTDLALSVTGVAGPDGGSPQKPVGYICFGLATPDGVITAKQQYSGQRSSIRARAAQYALRMLWEYLINRCADD
jgi:nicotinamide-nucleotide amidase